MPLSLETDIKYLKGIGEKRAQVYAKLGISTVLGLLYHFPRGYIDLTNPCKIKDASPYEPSAVRARVVYKGTEQRIRKGMSVFKVLAADDEAEMQITFFNSKYTVDSLKIDEEYIFYGTVKGGFLKHEMSAPAIFGLNGPTMLVPVYPLTAGLTSKSILANVCQALSILKENLPDFLPDSIRSKYKLATLDYAIRNIHLPANANSVAVAKKRLIFDELFLIALSMKTIRGNNKTAAGAAMRTVDMSGFFGALGFSPTNAQLRAIGEAVNDMCSGISMNRLVQGDVGSGKTLVAQACAYFAAKNGYQSAMMVPTEILAEQHYESFGKIFEKLGIKVGLLTGSMKQSQKNLVKKQLQNGEIDICIGTHALISQSVEFKSLALVITDEQHRFGVNQRANLTQKGNCPNILVMSATPIPRTLALIIYGDLTLSVIDELPPGRQTVETYKIDSTKRDRAYGFIKKHIDSGRQAFIVCPLIEQGEVDMGLTSAAEYAAELAQKQFAGYKIALLHGKQKQKEKDEIMRGFRNREFDILVSTTVIEVGVDIPNAVIMLIENAERFGLSQLHQLRGRVGRGSDKAYCILLSDAKSDSASERLGIMCKTNDGFKIAEYDLKTRGPGDFIGIRQHGLPQTKLADYSENIDILQSAQEAADTIYALDPLLEKNENFRLKKKTDELLRSVGYKLN
ncbi:MAG TPA: ATP-dependent DNA helicase RecG [Ruminococcaceae bacterium]|nr:ATP-dependent DNA helicase RecG [Oscillospiraceae bacterium]